MKLSHITDDQAWRAWIKTRMIEKWTHNIDWNIRSQYMREIYYSTTHWRKFSYWRRHWWFGVTFLGWDKCKDCGSREYLQCHHLTYKHLWMEHLFWFDLVNVCDTCHKKRESRKYQGWRN